MFCLINRRPTLNGQWLSHAANQSSTAISADVSSSDFQSRKPSVPSNATALGCAARFNLPTVDEPNLMNGLQFQGFDVASELLSSGCTTDPSEYRESLTSPTMVSSPLSKFWLARSRWLTLPLTMTRRSSSNISNVGEVS